MKSLFQTTLASAALALGLTTSASATTFVFDYTPNDPGAFPGPAHLILTTSDVVNAVGGYDILNASGWFNTITEVITGIEQGVNQPYQSVSADGYFFIDSSLFITEPHFTTDGPYFTTSLGNKFNVTGGPDLDYTVWQHLDDGTYINSQGGGSLSVLPEPGVWAMMILGFGLVGTALRRRKETVFA